jgi:hypothetical protein
LIIEINFNSNFNFNSNSKISWKRFFRFLKWFKRFIFCNFQNLSKQFYRHFILPFHLLWKFKKQIDALRNSENQWTVQKLVGNILNGKGNANAIIKKIFTFSVSVGSEKNWGSIEITIEISTVSEFRESGSMKPQKVSHWRNWSLYWSKLFKSGVTIGRFSIGTSKQTRRKEEETENVSEHPSEMRSIKECFKKNWQNVGL